jgi:hypothetical protein
MREILPTQLTVDCLQAGVVGELAGKGDTVSQTQLRLQEDSKM